MNMTAHFYIYLLIMDALQPWMPDHLDVYGDYNEMKKPMQIFLKKSLKNLL